MVQLAQAEDLGLAVADDQVGSADDLGEEFLFVLRVRAHRRDVQAGVQPFGPDEWFADLPAGTSLPLGAGEPVSVVDVSSRGVAFEVEGEKAAWVISAGCALDIANFAVGRVTRTMFETAEIILWRTGETSFRVFAWRSFGPWLWNALKAVEA